ncbi:hypothetical protein ACXR2U_00045 [Jatrophihabitans sp. YIM 134969]
MPGDVAASHPLDDWRHAGPSCETCGGRLAGAAVVVVGCDLLTDAGRCES